MEPEALHVLMAERKVRLVAAVTGGGVGWIHDLLRSPGGSAWVEEIVVPYGPGTVNRLVGTEVGSSCGEAAARALARWAWWQAALRAGSDLRPLGLGITAALATSRERRGEDRAWMAVASATRTEVRKLAGPDLGSVRHEQDAAIGRETLRLLNEETGCPDVEVSNQPVLGGLDVQGRWSEAMDLPEPCAIQPGSFDPLHRGHVRLGRAAAAYLGMPVALELSVGNVDKPDLTPAALRRRLLPLSGTAPVVVTRCPKFVDKAKAFPGRWFVIGFDTYRRLLDPGYYDSEADRDGALDTFWDLGTRFLVGGRTDEHGYHEIDHLPAPRRRRLFVALPGFREDVSSTAIRGRR